MSKLRFKCQEDGTFVPADNAGPGSGEQTGDAGGNGPIELGMPALNAADEAISEHLGDCGEADEGNLLEAQRNIDNARSALRQHAMAAHHSEVAGDDDGPADAPITEAFRRPTITVALRERQPRRARAVKIDCLEAR